MMRRMQQNLRIPGPTPIPDAAREAQSMPMIDHRGTEFAAMLREITAGIATLIGTQDEILLLTGSGSGALEAAVVNTLSPGDRVLSVITGGFGERFAAIAEAFGASVDRFGFEWGEPADPDALAAHLAAQSAVPRGAADAQRDLDGCHQPVAGTRGGGPRCPGANRSSWSTESAAWEHCRSRWTHGASTSC